MKKIMILLSVITLIVILVSAIAIYTSVHANDAEKASIEASSSESVSIEESEKASIAAVEAESESYAAIITGYEDQISAAYIDISTEVSITKIEDYITALQAIESLVKADTQLSENDINNLVSEIEIKEDNAYTRINIIKADINAALGNISSQK